jgi:putative transposase
VQTTSTINSIAEAFVAGIRRECLNKMILIGERHVRYVIEQYVDHYYNHERPHQGIGNRRIIEPADPMPKEGPVFCRERLGGLLKTYYRKAA